MFGLKKIFGFSSKEEPATLAYVRHGTMEPEAFAVLRRHLLALEAEKASAWEAAPDEDPRAAYRRFLSLTDCRHSFVVALEQNGRKLPVGEWAKNHEGAARLLDLVDNELAVLVREGDADAVEVSDIVLSGLSAADLRRLDFVNQGDIALALEQTGVPGTASRTVTMSWMHNRRRLLGAEAEGMLLKTGRRRFLIPPRFFFTVDAIDRYRAQIAAASSQDECRAAWAGLSEWLHETGDRSLSEAAGSTRMFTAGQISLAIDKKTGEIRPYFLRANSTPGSERKNFESLISDTQGRRVRNQIAPDGKVPSYFILGQGAYLFIPDETRLVLEAVESIARNGTPADKTRLLANPHREIMRHLEGKLPEAELEVLVDDAFIESPEFLSDRVEAFGPWSPKSLGFVEPCSASWFGSDEVNRWTVMVGGEFFTGTQAEIDALVQSVEKAVVAGETMVDVAGRQVPADAVDLEKLKAFADGVNRRTKNEDGGENQSRITDEAEDDVEILDEPVRSVRYGPVLQDNLEVLQYVASRNRRDAFTHELTGLSPEYRLLPHQTEALDWLKDLWNRGVPGALLADDMGLGKTLQCLSFIRWVIQGLEAEDHPRPALVVAPVGLIENWRLEAEKYYPRSLKSPDILTGQKAAAALRLPRPELLSRLESADWVLTNYETVRDKFELFGSVNWSVVVFDEAQKIKNPVALMTETAKSLEGGFTLMMTGTPVENSFQDLWSIMDAAVPGFMGSLSDFMRRYGGDADIEEAGAELNAALTGASMDGEKGKSVRLMLRRLKTERMKDLPVKTQNVVACPMPEQQANAYRAILSDMKLHRERKENIPIAVLQRLANCSLSPVPLFEDVELTDSMIADSGRLTAFFRILDDIAARREKVVVFVQHFDVQDVVARAIRARYGLDHMPGKINGTMPPAARQRVVTEFQNGRPGFDAVVLTGRAAGTGLTLTAANHVVHLERWWNPAVEDQCSDRVYRIGQTKDVMVHVPLAVFREEVDPADSPFDVTLHQFLERKRSRSQSVLAPSSSGKGDQEFIESFFGKKAD